MYEYTQIIQNSLINSNLLGKDADSQRGRGRLQCSILTVLQLSECRQTDRLRENVHKHTSYLYATNCEGGGTNKEGMNT